MDSQFDPYHKWLGIQLFESDHDVITAAAERQMAYLHQINTGPHLSDSQRILTEVAAAKVCLLDTRKRTKYDVKLKSEISLASQFSEILTNHDGGSKSPGAVPQSQSTEHRDWEWMATRSWLAIPKKLLIPAVVFGVVVLMWGLVVFQIPTDSTPPIKPILVLPEGENERFAEVAAEQVAERQAAEKAAAEKREADRLADEAARAEREAKRLAKIAANERKAESGVVEKAAAERREAERIAEISATEREAERSVVEKAIAETLEAKRLVAESVRTLNGHTRAVLSVAFSPYGQRLATGSDDRTAKIWDASTSQELLTLKGKGTVNSVAYNPDGRHLATGGSYTIVRVWDASTGQELLSLRGHTGILDSVAYSPDGRRMASGGGDNTVRVWDTSTGQELLTLKGHTDRVNSVAFSPDGQRLASGSGDFHNTVKVWNASTGQELLTRKGYFGGGRSVAFSPDGRRLATSSDYKTVKIWNASTSQELLTLKGIKGKGTVNSVTFSPDGRQLATGGSDGVKVWDASTGQELLTLKGTGSVNSVAYSPDGRELAMGGGDGTVKVWDLSPLLKLWGVEQQPLAENATAGKLEADPLAEENATGGVALRFDGKSSYVQIPPLRVGYKDTLVVEADATLDAFPNNGTAYVLSNLQDSGFGLAIKPDHHWHFFIHDREGYVDVKSNEPVRLGEAYQLAGIEENNQVSLYVNGRLQGGPIPMRGSFNNSSMPLLLGADPERKGKRHLHFSGIISRVKISREVDDLKRHLQEPSTRWDRSTVALYDFDEGQGNTLNDATGNRNIGNIVGAKWIKHGIVGIVDREAADTAKKSSNAVETSESEGAN